MRLWLLTQVGDYCPIEQHPILGTYNYGWQTASSMLIGSLLVSFTRGALTVVVESGGVRL